MTFLKNYPLLMRKAGNFCRRMLNAQHAPVFSEADLGLATRSLLIVRLGKQPGC